MRVLVVEDDPRIASDIVRALEANGYVVETVTDGEEAWFRGDTEDYAAIVLDLGLPKMDGLSVLKRWRANGRRTPVLILTARGSWAERVDTTDRAYIQVRFHEQDCRACDARAFYTQVTQAPRTLTLHPQAACEALQAARAWYASDEGQQRYQRRAGVEGTLSQGVRAFGLRCTRHRGLTKTRLQHVATAAAMNIDRIIAWLDERPRAKARTSRVAALAPACRLSSDAPSL